jgi:hypothetical protein
MSNEIHVGCNVLVTSLNGAKIGEITRETKIQWVVQLKSLIGSEYEEKFRKDNLNLVGGSIRDNKSIAFISDEDKKKIETRWDIDKRKRNVVFVMSKMNPKSISDDDLLKYELLLSKVEVKNG